MIGGTNPERYPRAHRLFLLEVDVAIGHRNDRTLVVDVAHSDYERC